MVNLKDILKFYKISITEVAEALGITLGTASLKVNGKYSFTVKEAKELKQLIKDKTGRTLSLDFLFDE